MRCATCNADNPRGATTCVGCGASLTKKPRRRGAADESDSASGGLAEGPNRGAAYAYRLAVLGLVPGLGLLLGPAAAVLGGIALLRNRGEPDFTARGVAVAAGLLGALVALTNWAGLLLMLRGLSAW